MSDGAGMDNALLIGKLLDVMNCATVVLQSQLNPTKTLVQLISDRRWLSVAVYSVLIVALFR